MIRIISWFLKWMEFNITIVILIEIKYEIFIEYRKSYFNLTMIIEILSLLIIALSTNISFTNDNF